MKKIGIVTMYKNNNYGSSLQCFSTIKYLEKMGFKAVAVQRADNKIYKNIVRFSRKIEFIIKSIIHPRKGINFIKSQKESKRGYSQVNIITKEKIHEFNKRYIIEENKTYNQWKKDAKQDEYKAFFSGSDQIWNISAPYLNPMNFLRFAPKNKRIAFAPSFGVGTIPKYEQKKLSLYINEYKALSIREDKGAEIIKDLIDKDAEVLIDPTLIWNKEYWNSFVKNISLNIDNYKDGYILLYFLNNPSKIAISGIARLKEITKLPIITLPYEFENYNLLGEYNMYHAGPDEFVSLISNASFVFTDSFHGTAFSINLNIPFITFEREYGHNLKQSSRISSLLKLCNLENRFIEEENLDVEEWLNIDYKYSNSILDKERNKVDKYVRKALDISSEIDYSNII